MLYAQLTQIIMIILLYLTKHVNMNIWMDAGQSSSNTRRYMYVDITNLSQHLGPITCNALLGFPALTGSEYTSSFLRKGKVNPLKLAEKCPLHLEGLGNLGESKHLSDCDPLIESYVCHAWAAQSGVC